jgi:hypothetical protein
LTALAHPPHSSDRASSDLRLYRVLEDVFCGKISGGDDVFRRSEEVAANTKFKLGKTIVFLFLGGVRLFKLLEIT